MATTSITFTPKIGYFFNESGQIVLTDITGDQSDWNPYGWGGLTPYSVINPERSSVTSVLLTVVCYSEGTIFTYYPTNPVSALDILPSTDFLRVNKYAVIDISNLSYEVDLSGNVTEVNSFRKGYYAITTRVFGTFAVGSDTVNWNSAATLAPPLRFGAFNLPTNCLPSALMPPVFTKNCKPNKKAMRVLRAQKMMYDYWNYNSINNTVADLADFRFAKTTDIYQYMVDACNNKNNCKC